MMGDPYWGGNQAPWPVDSFDVSDKNRPWTVSVDTLKDGRHYVGLSLEEHWEEFTPEEARDLSIDLHKAAFQAAYMARGSDEDE